MSQLSEILGSLMVSLVHARRMADEETARVAEYYKDHPLLEGLSLPRVRVPELTIDMPVTIDDHQAEKAAEMESPTQIHKAVVDQLRQSLDDEDILTDSQSFQNTFDAEAKKALTELAEKDRNKSLVFSREAVVRAIDGALYNALKKSGKAQEYSADQKTVLHSGVRHRVSAVSIKRPSEPSMIMTSATSSDVKEHSTPLASARLQITLREEGLEWATAANNGGVKSKLQPE